MQNPCLLGARAKISRAEHHLSDLNSRLRSLFASQPDRSGARHQYNPERQELIISLEKAAELGPQVSLIIGDCIHNARSALDHMVCQLAILNRASRDAITKTAFPVYLTEPEFNNFADRKVKPFITSDAFAEIKKLQPYYAGNAGVNDVLWCLSQLDIFDKHRLLIVVGQKFRPIAFSLQVPTGEVFSHEISGSQWKPAVDGAEILRFDLSGAIRQPGNVQVKLRTSSTVRIIDTGLDCDAFPVQQVLSDCIQHVSNIVSDFGNKFFGE